MLPYVCYANYMDTAKKELIEDLPLSADHLIYLVLIVAGKKPAAWLQYSSHIWREGDAPRHIPAEDRALIESSLQQLGLSYKIESRITDAGLNQPANGRRRHHELLDIFVAKNDGALASLLSAREAKNWRALGTVLGYPQTAVDAFADGKSIGKDELPIEVQLSEPAQFIGFKLSPDNWKDELQEVETWATYIKENTPIVYFEYLNRCASVEADIAEKILKKLTK